jgi:hypothetical protein
MNFDSLVRSSGVTKGSFIVKCVFFTTSLIDAGSLEVDLPLNLVRATMPQSCKHHRDEAAVPALTSVINESTTANG